MPWEPLPGSRREPKGLGESLDRVVRSLGGPGSDVLATVFTSWDEVVGERLAGHTRPLRLAEGRLVVAVEDPAWAPEVRFLAPDLLVRLAERLGPGVVTAVDVAVRPADGR